MSEIAALIEESPSINQWFGLSRCAYFVMPRLAMEAMPADWQRRFIALLNEADALGLKTPDYHVLRGDKAYTATEKNDPDDEGSWAREFYILQADEWANYRHGSVTKLCPEFRAMEGDKP